MPPRPRRLRHAGHSVTAVVVSHDGGQWLPDCLAALAAQTRPPQRVVAVDTASHDTSSALLTDALGAAAVVARARDEPLGAAVQAGLDAFAAAPPPPDVEADAVEWVWVLHDDCAPDDDALEQLLERAEQSPSASVIGPKVLSWDRRVLREVGVTIDSSGRRVTGLEPREVDQGQHDDTSDVLAVGTAGMLVRRDVWDRLGGLDRTWVIAVDDVDFGWRVTASGGRVLVAPRAVVRHRYALATGARRAATASASLGAAARGYGMQVVLANTSPWLVAPLAVRLVVESLLRAVWSLLLLRSPRRARDELVGLALMVAGLPRVLHVRRARRRLRARPHHEIRGLLAPPGWRVRAAGDAVAAVFAGRPAVDERQRRRAPVETGPVAAEAESFTVDDLGVLARFLTRPGVLLILGLTVVALVADRHVLGGVLHGGRLLPAPAGASDLWSDYVASWHSIGLGSTTAASPFLAVLAALSTLLLGKVWLLVDVLVLGAVPLAGWSAYVGSGAVTRRWPLRVWAAVSYAVVPAVTGAVADGRLDVIIAVVLLPVTARAMAAAVRNASTATSLHASVGSGLLLAVVVAAVPAVWPVAVVALVVAVAVAGRRGTVLRRLVAAAVAAAVPVVVLLPLVVATLHSPAAALAGAGLPESFTARGGVAVAHLLLLHPDGPAQPPLWVWAPVVLGALVGLATTRRSARAGVIVFVIAAAGAVAVSRLNPTAASAHARYWSGGLLAVAAVGALAAATAALDAAPQWLRRRAFGWRHAGAAVLAATAVVGTATAVVTWIGRGSANPLTDRSPQLLPVFAQAEAAAATTPRSLVVRSVGGVVHYALLRSPAGLRMPAGELAASRDSYPASRAALDAAVADASAGRSRAAQELAEFGITLVVVPAGGDDTLAAIAAVDGLARVPATSTVVYRATLPAGELVVLDGADAEAAAAGRPVTARAAPKPLTAAAGRARVTVGPGGGDRLLVLAEPHSPRWRASVDGHALQPAAAYGWAQAWHLPADGGTLVVARRDDGRGTLLGVELALLVVAAALSVPVRGVAR